MQLLKKYPHPERPANPSSLEMAIYNFELKAKLFHDENNKNNPDSAKLKKLTTDYEHLQKEKKRIESVLIAQSALAAYRESNRLASTETLLDEEHHPTDSLAKHLFAVGEPKPTKQHEAHHIISGKGRYNQEAMLRARLNLHMVGVGINDPFNGIWLINFVKNKAHDWATPESPPHRKIHRYNYESWIGGTLGTTTVTSKEQFLNKLRNVKIKIRIGLIPSKVFEKKDELWKGL